MPRRRTSRRPRRSPRLRANIWPFTRRPKSDVSAVAQQWRQEIHDTYSVIKHLLRAFKESFQSTGSVNFAIFDAFDHLGYMRCQLAQLRELTEKPSKEERKDLYDALSSVLDAGIDKWIDAQILLKWALWEAGLGDYRKSRRISLTT